MSDTKATLVLISEGNLIYKNRQQTNVVEFSRQTITIGRDPAIADVCVRSSNPQNTSLVSKYHCSIICEPGQNGDVHYFLIDKSRNGTFLNTDGNRLEKDVRKLLTHDDVIHLGTLTNINDNRGAKLRFKLGPITHAAAVNETSLAGDNTPINIDTKSLAPTLPLKIFISYPHEDTFAMNMVKDYLYNSHLNSQLIIDTDKEITKGSPWANHLEQVIQKCHVFIGIMTPNFPKSDVSKIEIGLARRMGKRIIPLIINGDPDEIIPFVVQDLQYIDLRRQTSEGLAELMKEIEQIIKGYGV